MTKIIKLLRRAPKKNFPRPRTPIYELCVVKKGSHNKFVFEKLGTYSLRGCSFSINIFRLCYWFTKSISLSGNAMRLLIETRVLTLLQKNEIRK